MIDIFLTIFMVIGKIEEVVKMKRMGRLSAWRNNYSIHPGSIETITSFINFADS